VPDSLRRFTAVVETCSPLTDPASLLGAEDALDTHPARVAAAADPSTVEAACRGGFGLVVVAATPT
jgi:hypothetical protein